AIRDIAARAAEGVVPTRRAAARLSDAALIERLTVVRGVGRRTVEMMLMGTLGRLDILPVVDFGVREGYRVLNGLDAQPKPRDLAAIGEMWAPYRSVASWYLWRAADLAKVKV
ncbi:MAG: DNA-3-methyladenine glycosylase 2 family protein, partial [Acetobacteraceae bacterium]|nr:DNA-3-methyladenine glycosylase 2 family protein [Acetobacteraceae bacterium]